MLTKKGYNGLKTGVTEAAGPCLAASYQVKSHHFIVVVLNSKTMQARWEEVPQLVEWALTRDAFFLDMKNEKSEQKEALDALNGTKGYFANSPFRSTK